MKNMHRDRLAVKIYDTREEMGRAAAKDFAAAVRTLLARKERLRVIFAAAPSQNDFLKAITEDETIDFSRIDAFHMDEYVGLDHRAPQAFGQFLRDRLFDRRDFHSVSFINGESDDPERACREYADLLSQAPIDIVCMGIGENGHIAFNEPYTSLTSRTGLRDLTTDTRIVNSRFFGNDPEAVPAQALRQGLPGSETLRQQRDLRQPVLQQEQQVRNLQSPWR